MAEPPQYKEKQTILPHPISHDEAKKTYCKRSSEGKAKRAELKKQLEAEGISRRSSESGTDDSSHASVTREEMSPAKKKLAKEEPKIDMRKMVIEHNLINKVVAKIASLPETPPKSSGSENKTQSSSGRKEKKEKRKHKDEGEKTEKKSKNAEAKRPKLSSIQELNVNSSTNTTSSSSSTSMLTLVANQVDVNTTPTKHKTNLNEPIVPPALPLPLVPPNPFTHREAYVNSLNQKEPEIKIQVQIVSDQPRNSSSSNTSSNHKITDPSSTPQKLQSSSSMIQSQGVATVTSDTSMDVAMTATTQNHIINSVEEALTPAVMPEDVLLSQPQLVVDHEEEVTISEAIESTTSVVETTTTPPTIVNFPTPLTPANCPVQPPIPPLPPLPPPPPIQTPLPPPPPPVASSSTSHNETPKKNSSSSSTHMKNTKVSSSSSSSSNSISSTSSPSTKSHKSHSSSSSSCSSSSSKSSSSKQNLKSPVDLLSSIMASMDTKNITTTTTTPTNSSTLSSLTSSSSSSSSSASNTSTIMSYNTTTPTN